MEYSVDKIFVHKNLNIHNNKITRHNTSVLNVNHVDGLVFQDNEFTWSEKYARKNTGEAISFGNHMRNFNIQELVK